MAPATKPRENFQPCITRFLTVERKAIQLPQDRSRRTIMLVFYLRDNRKQTVFLHNVGPRIRLFDHTALLRGLGISRRPYVKIYQTVDLTVVHADGWQTIGWCEVFDAPPDHTKPVFIQSTNEPLPQNWMNDIVEYAEPL
ncbi:hypothetical protein BDZ89DRAFT_1145934 [Hymenopellis radicata]|nr:hypothetical protein BDZ89DRAFT_1145934 [Hymenopellis radicata]